PTRNVFWSADSTEAPSTAIKGLNSNSVVHCSDCHSQMNASGPHGGSAAWNMDPNYPYPFKYAIVGGPAGANSTSTPFRAGGGVTAATPTTVTFGVPASASGIKARIAAFPSTATLDTSNYLNYPDYQGATYIADATTGQYAVICAKCHDLFNRSGVTTNAVDNGWSNAGTDSYEGLHGAHAGGTARNGADIGRIDGRSDCVNCHIAVTHGWKQPRLLVNGYTGTYQIGGSFGVPGTMVPSIADPAPYWVGRGMPFANGNSPGNGPNDPEDNHAANAFGLPVWEEAACISCSGAVSGNALEHAGVTAEPAKIF
ncbi:MAG: hypothetical protein WCP28_22565, partial [Actinomycetes bacterium]